MSSIDERIVAMRFDNGQFEKGVKQSMRTLQELREATNLDDVAASMGDVSKSINQNLQFQSPTKSAGIFSKALTSLGKVAKTTFNAATFPLQALGRSLQSLGKYTRAVLGIDIASQLVQTGEQVIRAFTIDPLKSGWNEYELKMDSIKTIMTGTVKTYTDAMTKKDPSFLYDEEKHLDYVKQGLEELNKYADDTVYSFQDMTSNIGKFTNAGVDFDTAVDAIKGVANAAAHAGQGAAQASSAMYNISQSLGMGYLGMMDWRSIENANMATLTFKQTLIDMGVALGQLKKDEKSGKLYTINEKGVVDNSMEVTAENLRETLSKKWVNKEVLLNALRVYSGEFSEEELRGLKNLSDEEKAQLRKIGEEAALAATQVRTFTKMWDALKEAAQSGWAISWELVFGDLNEATEFWTNLNNRFSALLDKQAKSREAILRAWRGQQEYWDPSSASWTWVDNPEAEDGRKILIDALNEMLDTIGGVGRGISEAWTSIFGTITGQNLLDATKKLKGFTKAFSDWLGKGNDKSSRISKLTTGLKGIFSVLKGAGSTVKGAITTISQTLHLDKLLDAGISVFGKAGEWLGSLGASISGIWESIGQTEIMQKLSGFFDGLWESVSKFFTETNAETGNTSFVDWIDGLIAKIQEVYAKIKGSTIYTAVQEFFTNLWTSVSGFFTSSTEIPEGGSWQDSPIGKAITSVGSWIQEGWHWIEENLGPVAQQIGGFLTDTWGWIMEKVGSGEAQAPKQSRLPEIPKNALKLAGKATMTDFSYAAMPKEVQKNAFITFFEGVFKTVGDFVEQVKNWNGWNDVTSFFRKIFESLVSAVNKIEDITGLSFLNAVAETISSIFSALSSLVSVISDVIIKIGKGGPEAFETWLKIFGILFGAEGLLALMSIPGKNLGLAGSGLAGLGGALLMMAGAVAILGSLNLGTLAKGVAVVAILGAIIGAIGGIASKITGNLSEVEQLTGWPKVVNNLVNQVAKYFIFSNLFSKLPEIIKAWKGTEGTMEGFFGFASGLAVLFVGLSAALKLMPNIGGGAILTSALGFGVAIQLLLTMFRNIAEDIGTWYGSNDNGFRDHFEAFGDFLGTIGEGIGKLVGGLKKGGLIKAAEGMEDVTKITANISEDEVKHMSLVMDLFTTIVGSLAKIGTDANALKMLVTGTTLSGFASGLESLGHGVSQFGLKIMGQDVDAFTTAANGIYTIVKAAGLLMSMNMKQEGSNSALDLFYWVQSFSDLAKQVAEDGETLDNFRTFADIWNDGIAASAEQVTIEPIIQSVLTQLSSGKARIAEGFGDMFPTSLRPVYDVDNETNLPLLAYQNGSVTLSGTVQIDETSLSGVVSAIESQGRSISNAISNLGSKMDSVASAVRSMKMVLDIGVVAGAVDDYIGNQSTLNGRTGTGRNTHGPVMNNTQQYNNYVKGG